MHGRAIHRVRHGPPLDLSRLHRRDDLCSRWGAQCRRNMLSGCNVRPHPIGTGSTRPPLRNSGAHARTRTQTHRHTHTHTDMDARTQTHRHTHTRTHARTHTRTGAPAARLPPPVASNASVAPVARHAPTKSAWYLRGGAQDATRRRTLAAGCNAKFMLPAHYAHTSALRAQ